MIHASTCLDKYINDVRIWVKSRRMHQRGPTIFAFCICTSTSSHKQPNSIRTVIMYRKHQRRHAIFRLRVNPSACADELSNDFNVRIILYCKYQWRLAKFVSCIHFGARRNQVLDDFTISIAQYCDHQRRPAILCAHVHAVSYTHLCFATRRKL